VRSLTPAQIRQSRERLDMTQMEFCKAFHLEPRTYQKWACGENLPSARAAVLLWLIRSHSGGNLDGLYVRAVLGCEPMRGIMP
jgi:DNA-binding transcriptional regulator YiaG